MIKIVTDSTHYLPSHLIAEHDIHVVPVMLLFGDKVYYEGIDIDSDTFFQRLASNHTFPTTSQPSTSAFLDIWRPLLDAGHEVITILLSAKVSGTFDTAQALLKHLSPDAPISIVDSASTATGMGFQVLRAAELVEQGLSRDKIVDRLQKMQQQIQIMLVPDTLEYLHRGGRINAVSAWLGNMLSIKPLLSFSNGFLEPIERIRTLHRAKKRLIELTLEHLGSDLQPWISVMHSRSPGQAQDLLSVFRARFPGAQFFTSEIGPALGVHIGPGGVGVISCPSQAL